jgi:hypothetical protein
MSQFALLYMSLANEVLYVVAVSGLALVYTVAELEAHLRDSKRAHPPVGPYKIDRYVYSPSWSPPIRPEPRLQSFKRGATAQRRPRGSRGEPARDEGPRRGQQGHRRE